MFSFKISGGPAMMLSGGAGPPLGYGPASRTWVAVPTEPISTKLDSFVDLADVIDLAKFGVD